MYRNLFIKEFVNFALSDKEEGRNVPEAKRPGRSSDPDNYKELELDYKVETPFGELKVYFIQNDRKGQMAVREIMNAQKGKHWKGLWAPLYGDGQGGLDQRAFEWWEKQYNLIPKRAAFLNGDIVAFCASAFKETVRWYGMDGHSWESQVPLVIERESVVRKVGDFLKICGKTIERSWLALKDSGIDDINSMEVKYIEKKTYLYDEEGGDIVVDTRCIPQYVDDFFMFKKGNIELGVDFGYGETYYIARMRKDNGDGTYTYAVYDRDGREISKAVTRLIEKHGEKHPTNELN